MHSDEFKKKIYPLKNRLFRFARWLVMDDFQAEDFVQDVFLKLWKMKDELPRYDNPEALAMKMIKNLCLNEQKKLRRFVFDLHENQLEEKMASPYEKMVVDDRIAVMNNILLAMPEQQRTVVQLRDIEGLDVGEIALLTDLTENNIWVILSRARKHIREAYLKFEENEQKRNQKPHR